MSQQKRVNCVENSILQGNSCELLTGNSEQLNWTANFQTLVEGTASTAFVFVNLFEHSHSDGFDFNNNCVWL